MNPESTTLRAGDRLPALTVPTLTGSEVALRSNGRNALVLVLLHEPECTECLRYMRQLGDLSGEFVEWDGRVAFVALPDASQLRGAIGIDAPAVIIADQWSEVAAVAIVENAHDFMEPQEVLSWLRHLGVRCPECEGESR